ncbi:MAG TPA: NAD(P)H-quinone oxidoreductase [Thermoanaerobaculia bacterium]|nr:NAD(P)H-quinone oxidoreductase [Thermoanaerobaculia bacterium]
MIAVLPVTDAQDPTPKLGELPDPLPGRGEVLIDVAATAINHADLLQLRGFYPPPPGESAVPGLECAGRIAAVGEGVDPEGVWKVGTRVMALLGGGGHGTRAAAPVGQLMAIPENLSFVQAAALPEAGLTAWTNLVAEGRIEAGEAVLVNGATGGMGTMFVQLASELGARVIAAGRHPGRLERLRDLGIHDLVSDDDGLPERVRERTGGQGVDLAIDLVGGPAFGRCLAALRGRGRMVLVGLTAGRRADVDLGVLLSRRLRVFGSVLRARSREEKARLVADFTAFALPRLADGRLRPVIDRVLPFERIAEAYAALAKGGVAGKVVLEMGKE